MSHIVRRPVANLVRHPDPSSELVSQLLLGAEVRTLKEAPGWLRVAGEDEYPGWAEADAFSPKIPEERPPAERRRIRPLYANLRHEPSSRCGPALLAPKGALLPVAGRRDGWTGLRLPDGRVGWVEDIRVEPDAPYPTTAPALMETARAFLGVPYLWGGGSAFGIDCSGFTQAVFRLHGIALPRDAHQQAEGVRSFGAESVSGKEETERAQPSLSSDNRLGDIRPGDLLFFAEDPTAPREDITHVALASGSGRMIHALGGREVVETPVEAVRALWGVQRLLPDAGPSLLPDLSPSLRSAP